ncbi:UDP-N-acetylmuramyl pentapeptide phosphotransferase/UDP-N-acetylglucosamine-1-phosphate transferase [Sanguibacter keddieii DSM 10542]|uniref:UDP-N-acetylmuramyl pentapeptide phosphotransferase/UDP-N-acetylglucosamine-1-phosphate transferase n=1 Tax=Sanguibacter keddieii (strain ATCC 51767 / DSM 10542 / NCFB 3025 / ST-74) TaxID=446469 RepID=D1BCU6_SANKS|nr:MraY family glycosyltransferase [Sanguibacter keddieii]ACZ20944.1 UDP-N-acetylmuramyl pentapeptide phosphotransferase/UDP-N-acetylglucosamine-1-phosphate transferase [Sanguibacter keddieii DSM 10542]
MRVYLLVMLVAAAVTYLATPFARWLAVKTNAVTAVRSRDVHTIPTPRLGGVAMYLGLAAAFLFASRMGFLEGVFEVNNNAWVILAAGGMVCLLGVADDIWDLDWMTKLVGQVLAAGLMAWQGVQLITVPIGGLTIGSSRLSLFVTVISVVIAMNAVNFVDGLDGLAAGMIAIGGAAFFVYTYLLTLEANPTDYSNLATLIVSALVGACLGFLPHNFHPSKIFMGDSGSMLIGLTMAAAAIVVTGQIDPEQASDGQQIPAFIPILLPAAVLMLPLLDMGLAVVRRLLAGKSPFHPDRMHLHHRLLQLGHSHPRAVVIMYLWSAVFSFGAAALVVVPWQTVLAGLGVAVVVSIILTLGPLRGRERGARHAVPGGQSR